VRLRHVIGAGSLALLFTSCSLGDSADTRSINVFLNVDKSVLPVGESLTIITTAKNVGYDPLNLTGPSNCLLWVEILSSAGQVIWRSDTQCSSTSVTETLAPGEEKSQTFLWPGTNQEGGQLFGDFHLQPVARLSTGATAGPLIKIRVGT
jgi:hypothetical protein